MMRVIAISIAFLATFNAVAVGNVASGNAAFNDGIDRTDPDFVTASLLIMSPGNQLYSCVGHSVLRLECPKFGLDNCFTYESESAKDKVLSFLAGNLKMGMFAVPTVEHLKICAAEGRGVMQYRLNLPPTVKQRLWKYLDNKVAEGINLSYDYLSRGCAYAAFVALSRSIEPDYLLQIGKWPDRFDKWTRREFVDAHLDGFPWNRFFIHTLAGAECDRDVPKSMKVVLSCDLLELLRIAHVNGQAVISTVGEELLAPNPQDSHVFITPMMIAFGFLLVSIADFFLNAWHEWVAMLFLVFQSLLGVLFTYLVCVSNLPATDWNWLIIPFNLLPLIFWKWRRKWALWFVGVLLAWEAFIIFYPHFLTDPAYLVLVAAYIVMFTRIGWQGRARRPATATTTTSRSCADIFEQLRRDNEAARKGRG